MFFLMELPATIYGYILPALMTAAAAIHLAYTLRYHLKSSVRSTGPDSAAHTQPVSVIICARNEAAALAANLPSVLEQKHRSFEVIVVNDSPEDDSDMVLSELKARYGNLKVSTVTKDPRFHHNRKLAQIIGVKAASNELILLTGPGCRPSSDHWITRMTAPLAAGSDIVLGYGGYSSGSGLLNMYARYDAMTSAMHYTGMALRGRPFRGVGRNLAYRKSLFMSNNGFATHYHLPAGEDELFVNANATASNTAVVTDEASHTRSEAPATPAAYIRLRRMQMASLTRYRTSDRLRLVAEPAARALFHVSAAVTLGSLVMWQVTVPVAAVTLISRAVVLHRVSHRFAEKGITLPAILFDIVSPYIDSLLYIAKFGANAGTRSWR